jgi:gentisate 1,2-dioxygenase
MRGIVIAMDGTFVKVLGIGTSMETGDTFVLPQRYVHDYPAAECHYMEKQTLSL